MKIPIKVLHKDDIPMPTKELIDAAIGLLVEYMQRKRKVKTNYFVLSFSLEDSLKKVQRPRGAVFTPQVITHRWFAALYGKSLNGCLYLIVSHIDNKATELDCQRISDEILWSTGTDALIIYDEVIHADESLPSS